MIYKILVSSIALSILAGCGSSSNDQAKGSGEFLATYELESGCSTGRQVFKAATEDGVAKQFCDALVDDARNQGCARFQRQEAFSSAKCAGAWPFTTPDGMNSNSSHTYGYNENGCSTGVHFIASSDSNSALKMYCASLKDDAFNRNCAKGTRDEAYNKAECLNVK